MKRLFRLDHLVYRLWYLMLALVFLTGCVRQSGKPVPTPTPQKLMARSVRECDKFNQGNPECVRIQYELNMRWYYFKSTRSEFAGPPGVPGPMPMPDPRHMAYHYPDEVKR